MIQLHSTTFHGMPCQQLSNDAIALIACPALGGKIVSLRLLNTNQELLWHNPNLKLTALPPGSAYDPNFFGGIDELLPNDEAETIHGRDYFDHGELWTKSLQCTSHHRGITLTGELELAGLQYEKCISLHPTNGTIDLDYVITNTHPTPNPILWKLHAAMQVHAGDRIICPAKQGELLDPDFANRRHGPVRFAWPHWESDRMDIVPPITSQRREFFFLSDCERGLMRIESDEANTFFEYRYDHSVFPYGWIFATYGGWNGLYTAVLEPCTTIPHVLSQSIAKQTCKVLQPGEEIRTRVTIDVGHLTQ